MSAERAFFDTNVLIDAFASNDKRADTAMALLARGGVVDAQISLTASRFAIRFDPAKKPWAESHGEMRIAL